MAEIRIRGQAVRRHETFAAAFGADPEAERWLFVHPHDDDAAIGLGMTIAIAAAEGVEVHILDTTDGRMGYCRAEDKERIAAMRQGEAVAAYKRLGVPEERIHVLGYADGALYNYIGRWPAGPDDPAVEGFTGLENSYTHSLRRIRPHRLFTPASTDLHPDHQAVHKDILISLFHASGDIWPELGPPCAVPEVYEYPLYVEMSVPPDTMVAGDDALFAQKLDAIASFASQKQVKTMVDNIREAGPVEFFRNVRFAFYHPNAYRPLFGEGDA
jgi:LmbE family N-acetylglucosaminyl deacetylase